jgi:xanthosine utilization system XapX-like protein
MIVLVGLFGMVLGQQAVDMTKRHFLPSAQDAATYDTDSIDRAKKTERRQRI